jgi:transposase-like protein
MASRELPNGHSRVIRILQEAEALGNVRDVCRQHNIAEQTLYRWRRQFSGMDVSAANNCARLSVRMRR